MIDLSIILPAKNEAQRLPSCMAWLHHWSIANPITRSIEIVIVENGSTDNTAQIAHTYLDRWNKIQVLHSAPGKGAAVRLGMLAATGNWRMMADVDLSSPPASWPRLFAATDLAPVVIGSREMPGSCRQDETALRHVTGRVFNRLAQSLAPGVHDTQCGFKLFRADVALKIFSQTTLDGFAFDVEALTIARRLGCPVIEIGLPWRNDPLTTVRLGSDGLQMALDLLRIHRNLLAGAYGPARPAVTPYPAMPPG